MSILSDIISVKPFIRKYQPANLGFSPCGVAVRPTNALDIDRNIKRT